MSNTVWLKNVKEGFTDTSVKKEPDETEQNDTENNYTVADYNNLPKDGKDAEENIIMSSHTSDPQIITPTTEQPQKKSTFDEIKSAFKTFDTQKMKYLFKDSLSSTTNVFKNFDDNVAKLFGHIVGDSVKSKESKVELKVVASQVVRWIVFIPMTYLVLINWWYLMCYTNYTFDFRKLIWRPSKWAMSGPINAFELLNYYMISFRMDSNRSFLRPETLRDVWEWRPILFAFIHFFLFSSFSNFDIIKFLSTALNGEGIVFVIILVLSLYYFLTLSITEKWLEPIFTSGIIITAILIAVYVLCFILMFLFIPILFPFFLMYILFLSYFAIFAFNWFWPPTILSIINQIFQELKEAYTQDPVDKIGNLGKVCFNNFHSIYLLFTVIIICLIHINQILSFRTPAVIGIAVIINLIICGIFVPNSFSVIYEILNVFSENTPEPSVKNPAEGT